MVVHTIFYVTNQKKSCSFYEQLLGFAPRLDVPGMTEFELSDKHILGLMPESGIKKLLGDRLPDPSSANGVARAELYIRTENPEELFERAKSLNAFILSEISDRSWGHRAGYVLDPDGYVLAFSS